MTEGVREMQAHDDEDRQSLNGKDTFSLTAFFFFSFFSPFIFLSEREKIFFKCP